MSANNDKIHIPCVSTKIYAAWAITRLLVDFPGASWLPVFAASLQCNWVLACANEALLGGNRFATRMIDNADNDVARAILSVERRCEKSDDDKLVERSNTEELRNKKKIIITVHSIAVITKMWYKRLERRGLGGEFREDVLRKNKRMADAKTPEGVGRVVQIQKPTENCRELFVIPTKSFAMLIGW